jgi:hypothetical protein
VVYLQAVVVVAVILELLEQGVQVAAVTAQILITLELRWVMALLGQQIQVVAVVAVVGILALAQQAAPVSSS